MKVALIRTRQKPDSRAAKEDVKRLEKFFYSEWYEALTDLDASYLLRKVREMVEEESR